MSRCCRQMLRGGLARNLRCVNSLLNLLSAVLLKVRQCRVLGAMQCMHAWQQRGSCCTAHDAGQLLRAARQAGPGLSAMLCDQALRSTGGKGKT